MGLLAAIREENCKRVAWASECYGRLVPLLTEDLRYWNMRRVFDGADLSLWLDCGDKSDPLREVVR